MMELLDRFDLSLDVDDVLRGQGANPGAVHTRKPVFLNAAAEALRVGLAIIHPVAILHTVSIVAHRHASVLLEGENKLTSEWISQHLGGAVQISAVLCTIGPQLETEIGRLFSSDPLLALALDGLGNAAVEKISQKTCEHIRDQAQGNGLTTSVPLSPGEPDWPVEVGQPQIFALLDPSQAGVTLTSTGMMIPKKSISFVVGIGSNMVQTDQCEFCSIRERCHYRHA
jgi:hypothetical protein